MSRCRCTPDCSRLCAIWARENGEFSDGVVRYTATVGTDRAREAVRKILAASVSAERTEGLHIQVTDGGSQAMELMILACCGPAGSKDKPLLIIDAAYTNYLAFASRLGRRIVSLRRYLNSDGRFPLPDQNELKQVFDEFRPGAVVIIPYDNPTGSLYRNDDLKRLAQLCVEYNCWLVSDEAYRELHYSDEKAPSVWNLTNQDVPGIEGRRIGIETASKVWNACGLRIGALVTDNAQLHAQCVAENTASLCPSAVGQAVFAALGDETEEDLKAWFPPPARLLRQCCRIVLSGHVRGLAGCYRFQTGGHHSTRSSMLGRWSVRIFTL